MRGCGNHRSKRGERRSHRTCGWRFVISPAAGHVTLSHSVAGLRGLNWWSLISKVFAPDNIFGSDGNDPRILFRASGPPCFQEDHATTRIESIFQCLSKLGPRILNICSPISSPTSRGFCTVKRRRFNGLGEMKTCLQSRYSPS